MRMRPLFVTASYLSLGAVLISACGPTTSPPPPAITLRGEALTTPIPPMSVVPQFTALGDGEVIASWFEPRAGKGYRFRAAVRRDGTWSPASTIDESADIAMFSADLPGVSPLPGGALLAYWEHLDRGSQDPTATRIRLARSDDRGKTWVSLPSPHREAASGEHSFMATFPLEHGLGLTWLDAQKQQYRPPDKPDGAPEWRGAIGLRWAALAADGTPTKDAFIDPITCECCPTAAARTARGPVIAYRDRVTADMAPEDVRDDAGSVRDIHVVRLEHGAWTTPRRVFADDWVINACPDNGPAIDAVDDRVAVAWWTGAGERPHVSVAFSDDSADTFRPPVTVSVKPAVGQVTIALVDRGEAAVVGWLEDGQAWARWVSRDGHTSAPRALGRAPRRARLPRWLADGDGVLALWTDVAESTTTVRLERLTWR